MSSTQRKATMSSAMPNPGCRRFLLRHAPDHAQYTGAFRYPPLCQHLVAARRIRRVAMVRRTALPIVVEPVNRHRQPRTLPIAVGEPHRKHLSLEDPIGVL